MNKKYLIASAGICLVIATFPLFFLSAGSNKWLAPVITFIASFIAGLLISFLVKKINRRTSIIILTVFTALVLAAAFFYINTMNKYVCSVPVDQVMGTGDGKSPATKNIITGTELIDTTDAVINLVNTGKNRCSICDSFSTNVPKEIWTQSSIRTSTFKLHFSFILMLVLLSLFFQFIAAWFLLRKKLEEPQDLVFISYNHGDQALARELCAALQKRHIRLIVDSPETAGGSGTENMETSADIYSFIKSAVSKAKITLMIVSEKSLLSEWVAAETINTFFQEEIGRQKSFIACYDDSSFLEPDFIKRIYEKIDQKREQVENDIKQRMDLHADSQDLNDRRTRLMKLRNNLDAMMKRLANSLCLDIGGGKLDVNIDKLVADIHKKFNENY